ncbi:hypothetical protein [Catellatospora bangladeshensis]|uniref:Uncharacterized protein n=1 Tax=Catellatospora bangladeshensis TaxID=310355 RepID=A0A8J3JI84_9ACTN|nr:hypothetical protein [Catellatospora bangladeshensis]GIF85176.1 hypothetical protein Cba03nite_65250 [Catellatospora bangladeshensis]
MAKNSNRPDRNPRADRAENAPHTGASQQHQAAAGMSAHTTNHDGADHEQAATATMQRKQQHEGASPTTMKSKKSNQPKHNQPKR